MVATIETDYIKSASVRFWSKVVRANNGSCLDWIGYRMSFGHGQFRYGFKSKILAHRFSYEQRYGKVPEGLFVLHDCDRPQCVNTSHLQLGTHLDNANDRDKRKRQCIGSARPHAKLTEADIPEIRKLLASGASLAEVGRKFNVSPGAIWAVRTNRTWSHVPTKGLAI